MINSKLIFDFTGLNGVIYVTDMIGVRKRILDLIKKVNSQ